MLRTFALAALTAGCGSRLDESFEEDLRRLSGVLRARRSGAARAEVQVAPDETAMLVTSAAPDPFRTNVRRLDGPGGERFDAYRVDAERSKTNGGYVASVASLNWPVTGRDPTLEAGRWTIELGLVDGSAEWTRGEIAVDLLLKRDDDFTAGALHASVVYADGVHTNDRVVRATEAALAHWAALYAQRDIALTWDTLVWDGDPLGPPGLGTPEAWEDLSSRTPLRTVNVVIASMIDGFDDVYGLAGDIPGPLVSTSRSGVLVASLLAAGPDGFFSKEEQRLYGETLAHEAGHFLGLFHPVEVAYDRWDALGDTPECDTEATCMDAMGDHLMFPFPVCGFVSCIPQDLLTDDQAEVMHRHVAVE